MRYLALDIGGANLKMADGLGFAESRHFEVWNQPRALAQELRTFIAEGPESDHLAVTMTAELADCFASKSEGVKFVLDAVDAAADARHTRVYLCDGSMVTPAVAVEKSRLTSASNWHALASFAGRYAKSGPALLVDVGSTTCDVIPLFDGRAAARGASDTERLINGELVYCGVERTPVYALTERVPYRGDNCPVVPEVFATAKDVYLTLGELPESPKNTSTADKRPSTKYAARLRLARSICADLDRFTEHDASAAAEAMAEGQVHHLVAAIEQVLSRFSKDAGRIIISGHGEFLARRAIEQMKLKAQIVSLRDELGETVSRCAPAHALAVLAREAAGA